MKLTQEIVRHLFDYDPDKGVLIWKNLPKGSHRKIKMGTIVTHYFDHGYPCIWLFRKNYKLHKIIWLYVHGYFPENDIDHKDRNKANNKLNNLREVSRQCNMRNSGLRKDNISSIVGVTFAKDRNKWRTTIGVNGKTYKLGDYTELIDAAQARLTAERILNWHHCDKYSTALQYVNAWKKENSDVENINKNQYRCNSQLITACATILASSADSITGY